MADLQEELQGLQTLQTDFARKAEVQDKIAAKKDKIAQIEKSCKNVNIPAPVLEDTNWGLQAALNKCKTDKPVGILWLVAFAFLGAGIYFGGFKNILFGLVNGFLALFGGAMGFIPSIIILALSVFLSRSLWSGATLLWQIVFCVLGLAWQLLAFWVTAIGKKEKKLKKEIEEYKIKAQEEFENAQMMHRREVAKKIKKKEELARPQIEEIYKEIADLRDLEKRIQNKINENPILDNADKNEELVDFVVSLIKRKRATSLSEALRLYDGEKKLEKQEAENKKREEERQAKRIADMRLQFELDKIERDRKAWADLQESNRQFAYQMDMKREQRKQSEELERIRKALEE